MASEIFSAAAKSKKSKLQRERRGPTPTTPRFWFLVGYFCFHTSFLKMAEICCFFLCLATKLPNWHVFQGKWAMRGWVWARTRDIFNNIHWNNYLAIDKYLGVAQKPQSRNICFLLQMTLFCCKISIVVIYTHKYMFVKIFIFLLITSIYLYLQLIWICMYL